MSKLEELARYAEISDCAPATHALDNNLDFGVKAQPFGLDNG